jgi:hypothetical protein
MGNENNRPEGNDGTSRVEAEVAYLEHYISAQAEIEHVKKGSSRN